MCVCVYVKLHVQAGNMYLHVLYMYMIEFEKEGNNLELIPYSGKIWRALNLAKPSLEVIGDF